MAEVMEEREDDRHQERARRNDDPAEQGTRGERDLPPNVQRERHDDNRQSER
jgi:hypothetical protein